MIDRVLVSYLSGALFFLSKSMGNSPYDYGFSAHVYELDKSSLIASYNKKKLAENDDTEDIEVLENLSKDCSGIKSLEKFIGKIFKGNVGNYEYLQWSILDLIDRISEYSFPKEFYICDFTRAEFNQSGKIIFVPIKSEFLVLHWTLESD